MAFISSFQTRQKSAGVVETINRNTARWASEDLLDSYTDEQLTMAMDRFFAVASDKRWANFVRSADEFLLAAVNARRDMEQRARAKEQLRRILDEF